MAKEHKPILVLDFDGVIHQYTSPWTRADEISDPPVKGAFEFIKAAQDAGFEVNVYSSRSGLEGGLYAMQKWMVDWMKTLHGPDWTVAVYGLIQWPQDKPPAFLTIDDRAITFEGEWPDPQTLLNFKPWNKR